MNAGSIDRAIDAFIEGDMDFVQLRQVIEREVGRNPARRIPARARLDALKEAGRMSHALHGILIEELEHSAFGEITVVAENLQDDEMGLPDLEPAQDIEPTLPDDRPQPEETERAAPAPRPAPLAVAGEVLAGRYALESVLGRGGMSVVFRARDLHMPEDDPQARTVAVKVLTPEFAGRDDAREALAREAAYARRLSHPGLVRVFDADVQGSLPFIVMELIEGERLRSLLVRRYPNPVPVSEALPIIRAVASILAHVHAGGLVHRDVKPANVFLGPQGQVRLLDLGLAGPHGELPGDNGTMRARTPAYSPPSALAGEPPVPADDVYALGCVAYEMLAGCHPFGKLPGDEAASRGAGPARIDSLPPGQWQALRRSLDFDADKRQSNAREFLDEFFAPPPEPAPARPWAAGGILAGLIAGLVLGWLAPQPPAVFSLVRDWLAPAQEPRASTSAVARPTRIAPPPAGEEALKDAQRAAEPDGQPDVQPVVEDTGGPPAGAEEPAGSFPVADGGPEAGAEAALVADAEPAQPDPTAASGEAEEEEQGGEEAGSRATPPPPVAEAQAERPVETRPSRQAARPAAVPPAPAGPPWLALPGRAGRVAEGESALKLSLARPAGYAGPLRVEWRTVAGTALEGDDYAGVGWQELEAPARAGALVLYVPIVSDSRAEPTESFFVEIRRARGGPEVGEPARLEVVITDDD